MNTFDYFVFVGTYTKPMWLETHETSEGIYTLEYNEDISEKLGIIQKMLMV